MTLSFYSEVDFSIEFLENTNIESQQCRTLNSQMAYLYYCWLMLLILRPVVSVKAASSRGLVGGFCVVVFQLWHCSVGNRL